MSIVFSPSGTLNVAVDSSELPEQADQGYISSGAMVRCKNLRTNEAGKAKTRDGSAKINAAAIDSDIWLIEEQSGVRYTFAGTYIYEDETVIYSGLTSAAWSAIKYNAYNDSQLNIFAINGVDRKRIQNGTVREWGITAPTTAPIIGTGGGSGLTGQYNVKYTYVRKSGETVVAESNPSPAGTVKQITNASVTATAIQPTDPQVTHIRFYRTLANGDLYYHDQDVIIGDGYIYGRSYLWEEFDTDSNSVSDTYSYGYTFTWEPDEFTGNGYKYSTTDSTHQTEDVYGWELAYTRENILSVSLSPTSITESESYYSSHTTEVVTASASYAAGSVSYSWAKVSGDAITISSPSTASTAFIADGLAYLETRVAIFRCTANDGSFTDYEDITVSITGYYLSIDIGGGF